MQMEGIDRVQMRWFSRSVASLCSAFEGLTLCVKEPPNETLKMHPSCIDLYLLVREAKFELFNVVFGGAIE